MSVKSADILSLDEFAGIRHSLQRIVATSGGFDPLHPGHVSCLVEAAQIGDTLVVLVNGDPFLTRKKGKPFMELEARCRVVSCIKGVDYVIPVDNETDDSVCEELCTIRPHVFAKGGDRTDISNIPEWDICRAYNIEIITGVGAEKAWSSSDYLGAWGAFWADRELNARDEA